MHVVITGATGNVGTALVRLLAADERIARITGIARRVPDDAPPKVEWVRADVTAADLAPAFAGADAVVHLAWEIQPSRDLARLWRTNVLGSRRVFDAAQAAGVPALVHASSIGVYSEGPSRAPVGEAWPREGVPTCSYALHKAECERMLDVLEERAPQMRVVRLRPALIFSRRAASGIARLFIGPLVPRVLGRRAPVMPRVDDLVMQAVHSDDVATAYRAALLGDVRGAFNVAADPPLDMATIARVVGARLVPVPVRLARAVIAASWRLRLQPTSETWLDMGLGVPLMDVTRARDELGWRAAVPADVALRELLDGMAEGAAAPTPALRPGRTRESPDEDPRVEEAR